MEGARQWGGERTPQRGENCGAVSVKCVTTCNSKGFTHTNLFIKFKVSNPTNILKDYAMDKWAELILESSS